MNTWTKAAVILWLCGGLSATAAQHSSPQPVFVPAGFHHFHHHAVFVGGGWWGYPYPYYYYGYPAGYYYGEAYEKVGKEWGKQLRKGQATVDQFITFLGLDILRASDAARSHFELGVVKGYGKNGLSLFTRALSDAKAKYPPPPTMAPPATPPGPAQPPAPNPPLNAPGYQ